MEIHFILVKEVFIGFVFFMVNNLNPHSNRMYIVRTCMYTGFDVHVGCKLGSLYCMHIDMPHLYVACPLSHIFFSVWQSKFQDLCL